MTDAFRLARPDNGIGLIASQEACNFMIMYQHIGCLVYIKENKPLLFVWVEGGRGGERRRERLSL